jgi:hypothetical protein
VDLQPIPKAVGVARYYAQEQTIIDQFSIELERIATEVAALEYEYGGGRLCRTRQGEQGPPYLAFLVAVGVLTIL